MPLWTSINRDGTTSNGTQLDKIAYTMYKMYFTFSENRFLSCLFLFFISFALKSLHNLSHWPCPKNPERNLSCNLNQWKKPNTHRNYDKAQTRRRAGKIWLEIKLWTWPGFVLAERLLQQCFFLIRSKSISGFFFQTGASLRNFSNGTPQLVDNSLIFQQEVNFEWFCVTFN